MGHLATDTVTTKRCSYCERDLPADEFSNGRGTCRTCNKVYCKGYAAGKRFARRSVVEVLRDNGFVTA